MKKKKKKRGRPVSVDITGDRRKVVKNIRFSKKEWDAVQQKMKECEMADFSEYARLACLQVDPVIFDIETFSSLFDLKRDLKIFLSKIDAVEFSKEELDNVKKCFSAITNFLERIFNPFSIKIK